MHGMGEKELGMKKRKEKREGGVIKCKKRRELEIKTNLVQERNRCIKGEKESCRNWRGMKLEWWRKGGGEKEREGGRE